MKHSLRKITNLIGEGQCRSRVRRLPGKGLSAALAALISLGALHQASGQGTVFTYAGQLSDGEKPANGSYDLQCSLFTVPSGGTLAAGFLTNSATALSNGLFTVALDFGAGRVHWHDLLAAD